MLIKATQKTTRQTPRKLALVANVVRGEELTDALKQLAVMDRRASLVILKVMRQAIANATHNHGAKFEDLKLKDIVINEGPRYKRWQAVSRGRAHGIVKRTSHVTVILEVKETEASAQPAETNKVSTKVVAKQSASAKPTQSKPKPKKSPSKKVTKPTKKPTTSKKSTKKATKVK